MFIYLQLGIFLKLTTLISEAISDNLAWGCLEEKNGSFGYIWSFSNARRLQNRSCTVDEGVYRQTSYQCNSLFGT